MQIKILSPLWGYEHLDINLFIAKIKHAGYDGIETSIPEDPVQKEKLFNLISKHHLLLVSHQHQAHGKNFNEFKDSFIHYLNLSAEGNPFMINSHTGRDFFTFEENLQLIDIASEFSYKHNITIAHETHRGRFAYSPPATEKYFEARNDFSITADLSHWVCVTESYLENFSHTVTETINRTRHIHARVGYEEGPQVPDPRALEWAGALGRFLNWWDLIIENRKKQEAPVFTITTEFGPPPYMPVLPFSNKPVADQFEINYYMKELLAERYLLQQ
ncbi:sugar phosphate isomerase/epimerase [Danxiaibacter flavus]|uniref:Sugar phosphate isomerase/epimerase n=1 Tax=Danxiaibacter flavus TaxID=3049108 RepID=A0ABV3Z8D6_9BACT|nr:sugar phosphate isomerase/epimerase [Chitinophagaceae bacterium DXS]